MPDAKLARKSVKARAAQQRKAGNLSKSEAERVERKADHVIEKRKRRRRSRSSLPCSSMAWTALRRRDLGDDAGQD